MSVPDHQINPPAEDPECGCCKGSGYHKINAPLECYNELEVDCHECCATGYRKRIYADDIAEAKAEERGDEARERGGRG